MKYRIITDAKGYPIQPKHINAKEHLFNAFDNMQTEVSAGWIVRFLQKRNEGWVPFTYEDINSFYSRKFKGDFSFNRLVDPEMVPPCLARAFAGHFDEPIPAGGGWIVKGDDGKYHVTAEFVNQCFTSSPAAI